MLPSLGFGLRLAAFAVITLKDSLILVPWFGGMKWGLLEKMEECLKNGKVAEDRLKDVVESSSTESAGVNVIRERVEKMTETVRNLVQRSA